MCSKGEKQLAIKYLVPLLQAGVDLIEKSHTVGLSHQDTHLENMMSDVSIEDCRSIEDIKHKMFEMITTLQFIDFGLSKELEKENDEEQYELKYGSYGDYDKYFGSINEQPYGSDVLSLLDLNADAKECYERYYG